MTRHQQAVDQPRGTAALATEAERSADQILDAAVRRIAGRAQGYRKNLDNLDGAAKSFEIARVAGMDESLGILVKLRDEIANQEKESQHA